MPDSPGAGTDPRLALLTTAIATNRSDLMERYVAAERAGMAFGGRRDYYDVLGYDRHPGPEDFYSAYDKNRGGIAKKVVEAYPQTCWQERPILHDDAADGESDEPETDFEEAIGYLFENHQLTHYLTRFDISLGIGRFGVLFFGVADGGDDELPNFEEPVEDDSLRSVLETNGANDPNATDDLAYITPFHEASIEDVETVNNPQNPRFGLPEYYSLEFDAGGTTRTERVHHTRVVHAAENRLESDVFGRSRLQPVYNRLFDIEKVVGGSSEMYWRGADRKWHLNIDPELGQLRDLDELEDEFEEMVHDMRSWFHTRGSNVETFDGDTPDPSGIVGQLLKIVAGETGIPQRILTGSERGELASTQDRATFLARAGQTQEQFREPMILRPVVDRWIQYGLVPPPEGESYTVEWPDLFELNELEQAELRAKNADALATATGNMPMQAATTSEIREAIMGWGGERGSESTVEDDELREEDIEETPETPEDREAFDEIQEIIENGEAGDVVADGGQG